VTVRALLVVALLASTLASAGPVVDMFMIELVEIQGKPLKGDASAKVKAEFQQNAKSGCQFPRPPGTKPLDVWFEAAVDGSGKVKFQPGGPKGGANSEVVSCAKQALLNSRVQLPAGDYRLEVKVRFEKTRYEIQ
jgi:hypothetical protein